MSGWVKSLHISLHRLVINYNYPVSANSFRTLDAYN